MKKNILAATIAAIAIAASAPVFGDSLFKTAAMTTKGTLIAKDTRLQIGDLITVQINENIASAITSNMHTKKDANVQSQADPSNNQFLINKGKHGLKIINSSALPNWNIATTNETKAEGDTVRNSSFVTSVSCVITEIMPNGMVRIDGEKTVTINREDCKIHLNGLVRIRDVTPANTIDSNQIANAVINMKGKGPLWNNQRRGLLTRFLDWVSPF